MPLNCRAGNRIRAPWIRGGKTFAPLSSPTPRVSPQYLPASMPARGLPHALRGVREGMNGGDGKGERWVGGCGGGAPHTARANSPCLVAVC